MRPPDTSKLFSYNNRQVFLNYLRGLRDNISADHLAAVKRLYGDRYTEGLVGVEQTTPSVYEQDEEDDD